MVPALTDPRLVDPRLVVPPLPPHHVTRPRLLAQLCAAPDPRLILISAGPGAGKTVLLSDWVRAHDGAVAWLTLTPADNEPTRFWPLFESLVGDIAAPAAPLVLVIDDAHVLTHPQVLDGLDSIVRGYPQLRLVLAGRRDPPLPLHRYRLGGLTRELRGADLAMTADEARALLAAHEVALAPEAFEALTRRTEGWAAGLRLSALRMTATPRPSELVAELALDHGSIGEYLIDEVLARQPPAARQVLIQTAFLDEVSGPLADAVTGLTGSAQTLVELARANAFVIALDAAQTRFRCHRLFAEILRHLLRQQPPSVVTPLYSRAAVWFAGAGELGQAIRWAAAAGDARHVARLVARGGLAQAFVARRDLPDMDTLQTLLDHCGAQDAAGDLPAARLALDAVRAEPGRPSLRTDEVTVDSDDPERALTVELAHLLLAEKRGDAEAVEVIAARLLNPREDRLERATRGVPGLRAALLLVCARARFWDGRVTGVEQLLEQARQAAICEDAPAVEMLVLGMIALVATYWSRPRRADEARCQAAERQRRDASLTPPLTLDLAAAHRAFLHGDLAATSRALHRASAASPAGSSAAGSSAAGSSAAGAAGATGWEPSASVLASLLHAQTLLASGQLTGAQQLLRALPDLDQRRPLLLAAYRDAMLATIETRLGRPHGALRLLRPYRDTGLAIPLEVVRARAHLALGELRAAADCIRRVVTGETSAVGRYVLVEALLCDAEIAQLAGDLPRGLDVLMRATEIAGADIVAPFARTADVFAPLLQRHPMLASQWPTNPAPSSDGAGSGRAASPSAGAAGVGTAVGAAGVGAAVGAPRGAPFPETLTDRERAVLRLLATSMSTAEIAEQLCVSVNTVKTHLAAIYRKLGARRRRDAIIRARDYEML